MSINELSDRNRVALMSKAALLQNVAQIRQAMSQQAELLAVVKANAYGHGAVQVARILEADGLKWLAVATIEEAMELRDAGIQTNLLILGIVPVNQIELAVAHDLSITVHELAYATAIQEKIKHHGKVRVHVKLDTGMTRLGFSTAKVDVERTCREIESIGKMPEIIPEGLFSHFAASEADASFTDEQIERFLRVKNNLTLPFKYFHIGNSGAIRLDMEPFNLVRAGIIMYGASPDPALDTGLNLKPVMSVMGKIVQIKTLSANETVGYSRTASLAKGAKLAIVELGYADGVPRSLSDKGHFLIKGQRARLVGRVSMDRVALDIHEIEATVGDWALFFGQHEDHVLQADDVALEAETIAYELFCRVAPRVPRIWK